MTTPQEQRGETRSQAQERENAFLSVEIPVQLVALVGFDTCGAQTALVLCITEQMEKARAVIYASHPDTDLIAAYEVFSGTKRKALYFRGSDGQEHKVEEWNRQTGEQSR